MHRFVDSTVIRHRATGGKHTIAAFGTILGLTLASALLATGTASAEPWNPNVTVEGRVFACGPRSFPLGIHIEGNTGDRGWAPVRRDGGYSIQLHRVAPRGEFIGGTVDCAWRPPARFGFPVQRPWRGTVVGHTI